MDKEVAKKPRELKEQKPVQLDYQLVDFGSQTVVPRLDRAFKILFDEMLRQGKIKFKKYPQEPLDS